MTKKLALRVAGALVAALSLLPLGTTPAQAVTPPVVANQTYTFDLSHPYYGASVTANDGGETLTFQCTPSPQVGNFYEWYKAPNGTYRLYFDADIAAMTPGTYPVSCVAKNSAGWVPFQIAVTVTGQKQPGTFHSLQPIRILDTRTWGYGKLLPSYYANVGVLGDYGVPMSGVGAIVANVTVTEPTKAGFVTAYPSGSTLPNASNVNFGPSQTVPNLVTVAVGPDGAVNFENVSAGSSHVIVDLVGYYYAGTPAISGTLQSYSPTRVLDTRYKIGVGTTTAVPAGGVVTISLPSQLGVPATSIGAAILNVTVTQPSKAGFITVFPAGEAVPGVSNLNYGPAQTVPNLVMVKTSADGKVSFKNTSAGTVHLIADLAGTYSAGQANFPGAFVAKSPQRILDTRYAVGFGGPVGPGAKFPLLIENGVLATFGQTEAVVLNVTATEPTQAGFVTVFPTGYTPNTSNLNYGPAQTVPNLVVSQTSDVGDVTLMNSSSGTVQLIADMAGYFIFEPGGLAAMKKSGVQSGKLKTPSLGRVVAPQPRR